MKNNILKLVLLLLYMQSYAQTNLIKNPGFEQGTIPASNLIYAYALNFRDNVPNWIEGCSELPANGNTPDILTLGASDCRASVPSSDHTTSLNPRLAGTNRYVYCGYSSNLSLGESVLGELTQTLTAGTYNISFYGSKVQGKNYCGWNGNIPATYPATTPGATVEVILRNSANGCTSEPIVWTSSAITSMGSWQQLSGSLVIDCDKAAKNYNRIEFRIKTPSASNGFFIDDVSLTKVNLTPVITGPDDFCESAPVYFLGSLSPGVTSLAYLWEIQECNSTGSTLVGSPLYSMWFNGTPSGFTFPSSLNLQCGKYYRVKLAPSNNVSCEWVERTRVIKINCDPAHNCPDPCFVINNILSTQNENSLYGPMPVDKVCLPTVTINGSCSTNESGYHLRIAPFNLNSWTFGPDLYSNWVTGSGAVPANVNLNSLIGSSSFIPGQLYIVALTVGPGWYSGEIHFFRGVACKQVAEEISTSSKSREISDPDSGIMNIYPNPTTGNVVVDLGESGSGNIDIYSLEGKLVFTKAFNKTDELAIDLSGFSKGIYTAQIIVNGVTTNKKIIKE